mgnify:FL=1
MKTYWQIIYFSFVLILLLFGCDQSSPPKEEIQESVMQKPVHSIPYNKEQEIYPYANTKEAYELAGQELKNPLALTEQNLMEGKSLYNALCKHCHGENGNANAPMIEKEKYPIPPVFTKRLPTISEGKMFHSITHGKNQMPPNGEDFSSTQKWLLVMYIQALSKQKEHME